MRSWLGRACLVLAVAAAPAHAQSIDGCEAGELPREGLWLPERPHPETRVSTALHVCVPPRMRVLLTVAPGASVLAHAFDPATGRIAVWLDEDRVNGRVHVLDASGEIASCSAPTPGSAIGARWRHGAVRFTWSSGSCVSWSPESCAPSSLDCGP